MLVQCHLFTKLALLHVKLPCDKSDYGTDRVFPDKNVAMKVLLVTLLKGSRQASVDPIESSTETPCSESRRFLPILDFEAEAPNSRPNGEVPSSEL